MFLQRFDRTAVAFALLVGLGALASSATAHAQGSTVVAWGSSSNGQTTVPAGLSDANQVSGGSLHSLAVTPGGTVVAWGDNTYGQTTVPAGLTGVVQVAAGLNHSLALKSDGTVVAWGDNGNSQTDVPAGLTGVVQVSTGGNHNLALKADGTVVAWGYNVFGQSTVPAGLTGVVQVSAGGLHSLALKADGTVVAWGQSTYGQTNVPAGLSGVVQVSAGRFRHNLAVKSDGTVIAWGTSYVGEGNVPAGLSGVVQVAAGYVHSVALKSDGTVVAWGSNTNGQRTVPARLSGVVQIAAGANHSLALVPDLVGTGEPVDGSGNPVAQPVAVPTGGDTVPFEASLTNNTASPIPTAVWLAVRFPDGTLIVKRRAQGVTVDPGTPLGFAGSFTLYESFPEGAYTLYGYYGTHPGGGIEVFSITIDKGAEALPKTGAAPSLTPAEIAALDPDAFLSFGDEALATTPGAEVPTATTLGSAYPNPFNPSATVPFTLTEASDVTLAVYDVLGREVAVLVDGRVEAGSHTVRFEAGTLPSGTYLVRFAANGHTQTQRLTLVK